MKAVLESSIVCSDLRLNGTEFEILLSSAKPTGTAVIMPRVVFDEVVAKHRERVEKIGSDWKRLNADAARLFGRTTIPNTPPWVADADGYESYLTERLAVKGVVIAPYPKISHEDVVKRILAKQMPFHSGEKGYRDYLIWHTVLEMVRTSPEEIAFITANTSDFGDGTLHADYLAELRAVSPSAKVEMFTTLGRFNAVHITPTLQTLKDLADRFNADSESQFSVKRWADKSLGDLIERLDYIEFLSPVEPDHAEIRLEKFEVSKTDVRAVLKLANGDLVVRATSRVGIAVSLDGNEDNMRYEDVREFFDVKDYEGVYFSAFATAETECDIRFSLVLAPTDYMIKNQDIDEINAFLNPVFNNVD